VETVGVGQSETAVAEMVDSVLLLLLPGAGDELQGIKRGILEQVDVVAVNKSDGERLSLAREARSGYLAALKLFTPRTAGWRTPVRAISGLEGTGLVELWESLEEHRRHLETSGELEIRRREQRGRWLWSLLEEDLLDDFRRHPEVAPRLAELVAGVEEGTVHPAKAAAELLARFREES
jgi:LAO/AO transport system kinase